MGKSKLMKKGEARALTISHPNSRKAARLSKEIMRIQKRKKSKIQSAMIRNLLAEKLIWFRDHLEPCKEYTPKMFDQLFVKYLSRFDEEVEQISIKHSIGQRNGRQHANREDIIRITKNQENEEYTTFGMEMVDILNPKQLNLFREWDGELGFLNQFKIKRFNKTSLTNPKPSRSRLNTECSKEEKIAMDTSNSADKQETKVADVASSSTSKSDESIKPTEKSMDEG